MNTTTQQDTQAAANKAAEEGGLPELPKAKMLVGQHLDSLHVLYSAEQVRDAQRAAIAADRASRQVANKAEVEPTNWRAKCEALIDIWDDAQANPPESRCYVENAWPELITELRTALATPPATTGASTAPVDTGSVARAWKSLADKAIGILQRNIVPDGISDHDAISELLGVFDGPEYRAAVAREVAAQAGQVAVPVEGQVAWSIDLRARLIAVSQDIAADDDARQVMAEAACLLAELTGAAPSPAKESK